jgi:hypothetical protein
MDPQEDAPALYSKVRTLKHLYLHRVVARVDDLNSGNGDPSVTNLHHAVAETNIFIISSI